MRFCGKCQTAKPDENFSPTAKWCKPCRNDYSRKHYEENKDRIRTYQNGWRDANGDLHRGYNAKYRSAHPEKAAESTRKWTEKNPVRRFAAQSLNFKRHSGHIVNITINDVVQMWDDQHGLCALSGIPMKSSKGGTSFDSPTLDRIVPSLGYNPNNVRLLCYAVNAGRGTLTDEAFVEVCRAVIARAETKG